MKTICLCVLTFFIVTVSFSQDKNFSVEVNYPLTFSNGIEKHTGIVGVGVKYRFIKSKLFRYGVSIGADYVKSKLQIPNDLSRKYMFYHIGAFAEMAIPSLKKIHPFAGIGYTRLDYEYEYLVITGGEAESTIESGNDSNSGYHFNIGIQYNITNNFFAQTYLSHTTIFHDNNFGSKIGINYNQIKLGVGFRI